MSIITEALKKAEKDRGNRLDSKEYIDKILGPGIDMSSYQEKHTLSDVRRYSAEKSKNDTEQNVKRSFIISGAMIIGTIIFLSIANVFIISSLDNERSRLPKTVKSRNNYIEPEAYSKTMRSDVEAIERSPAIFKRLRNTLTGVNAKNDFISNFELNGIIYDADNSWAIINNKTVKVGDTLDGAEIMSISQKEVMLLRGEKAFSLSVR